MSAQVFRILAATAGAVVAAIVLAAPARPAQAATAPPPTAPALSYAIDGSQADTNPADAWKGFGAVSANNTATSSITLSTAQTVALHVVPTSGALNPRIAFVAVVAVPTPPAPTAIHVSGAATKFSLGQPVDLSGLVVTADFADGSSEDVTAAAAIGPISDLGTAGAKTVPISYTSNGVTVTTSLKIVIQD